MRSEATDNTLLHTHMSPKASTKPRSTKTPQPCGNGTASAYGYKSYPTSMESRILCHSFKTLLTRYAYENLHSRRRLFKNEAWINTSAPWAKSMRSWGPQTPNSIEWAPTTCSLKEKRSSSHKSPPTTYLHSPHPGHCRTRRHKLPTRHF